MTRPAQSRAGTRELRVLACVMGLLWLAGPLRAAAPQWLSLTNGRLVRTFILYAPDHLPAAPVPLVLMLHGAGGTGVDAMTNLTEYRWNQLADSNQFLVAYPDGFSNLWHDCRGDAVNEPPTDDVAFLSALIDYIAALYPVDPQRIYAAGHSNGAMMCFCLASALPGRLAALCANCGGLAAVSDCATLSRPLSLLYCMGTADPIMPFNGGEINVNPPASGTVLPAFATIALWTNTFGIPPVPEATNTFPDLVTTDNSTVTEYDYQRVANGTELVYLQVNGGGHGWPAPVPFPPLQTLNKGRKNQDINLCDLAWEFFQRHALDGPPLRLASTPQAGGLQLQWNWGALQSSTNLTDWADVATGNLAATLALGLTNYLYASGGISAGPAGVPVKGAGAFYRLKAF